MPKNVLGSTLSTSFLGSTDYKLASPDGYSYSKNVPLYFTETGTTSANLKAYGLSVLTANTTATNSNKYTIDAPIPGVPKYLTCGASLGGSSDGPIVYTGSTAITISSTGVTGFLYLALGAYSGATLIGLSTSAWQVLDVNGTVVPSTST